MKKFLILFFSLLLLSACAPGRREATVEFSAMNTSMTITAHGDNAENAAAAARAEVFRLDALLSRTRPDSDVSRLNAAAGDPDPVPIAAETALLLEESRARAPEFDVTIAPVMDAWGFGRAEDGTEEPARSVPDEETLLRLLPLVNSANLEVDARRGLARLKVAGMEVDLGGIGKGYAGDRAAAVLRENGVESAILSLGGNITAVGSRPDGTPWRVGVKNPQKPDSYFCVLPLTDKTAATSGGYERYFVQNGVTYHHIINPTTGYPAETGLLSATVVTEKSADADLLSTYCFLLGPERALEYWRSREDVELILVKTDGTVLVTEGLSGLEFEEGSGYRHEIIRR